MRDSFGRSIDYLRISITDLCNLRCRYCMPAEGIVKQNHRDILSLEEISEIASAAVELGIAKIRLTGGEPLLRKGLLSLCRSLSSLPGLRELAITTNGVLLPAMAADLKAAGVSRLNISLDTLRADRYSEITRIGSLSDVLQGIESAEKAGFKGTKINVVLLGGVNDDEIADFVHLTVERPIDVRFIELMPIGPAADFPSDAYLPCAAVLERCPELQGLPSDGGVAELYRLSGAKGRVGLIRPLSCSFCSQCNRIRLTADGHIKPCLHSGEELPLRGLHGEELRRALQAAIMKKPEAHGLLSSESPSETGRTMNAIGG